MSDPQYLRDLKRTSQKQSFWHTLKKPLDVNQVVFVAINLLVTLDTKRPLEVALFISRTPVYVNIEHSQAVAWDKKNNEPVFEDVIENVLCTFGCFQEIESLGLFLVERYVPDTKRAKLRSCRDMTLTELEDVLEEPGFPDLAQSYFDAYQAGV